MRETSHITERVGIFRFQAAVGDCGFSHSVSDRFRENYPKVGSIFDLNAASHADFGRDSLWETACVLHVSVTARVGPCQSCTK